MLRNLSKRRGAKFPAKTVSYSIMVKIAHLDDAFSENWSNGSKPSSRSITAAKSLKIKKEKKERN